LAIKPLTLETASLRRANARRAV